MSEYYNRQWRLPNNENKDKQSNYSMDFDTASTNGINCGTVPTMFIGDSSVSIWFKSEVANTNNVIFGRHQSGSGNTLNRYVLRTELSGSGVKIKLELGTTGGDFYSQNVYSKSVWHHLVCTLSYSGGQYTVKFYVDGVEDSPTNSPMTKSAMTSNNTMPLIIGGMWNWNSTITQGCRWLLDGVAIYNYTLSSSQVTTLYGSSSTGIGNPMALSPKPVAYYPLGDQDSFNGSNYLVPNSSLKDYVFNNINSSAINTPYNLTATSNITVAMWFKTTTDNQSNKYLFSYGNSSSIYDFRLNGTGFVQPIIKIAGVQRAPNISFSYADGNWHQYVVNYDGSHIKVYIDGILKNKSSYSGDLSVSTNNFVFGNLSSTSSGGVIGEISNCTIHTATLTDGNVSEGDEATGEIATFYNYGTPIQTLSSIPQNSDLKVWYKLNATDTYDSSTGNWTITDHSSNSNDGTSSGMTQANLVQSDLSFTSGYSPYALSFDGINDYINCGNNSSLQFQGTDAFSLSLWVKYSSNSSNYKIFSNREWSNNYAGWSVAIHSGIVRFAIQQYYNYPQNTYQEVAISNQLNTNTWYNIVVTYSGTNDMNNSNIYINGADQTLSLVSNDSLPTITYNSNLNISSVGDGNQPLNGSISNAAVWNAALTQTQVTELYSEGIPQNLLNHSAVSSLVSWWQLGSNSSFNTNWTVLDEVTASGNNGTSVNMTEDDIVDGVGSSANGLSSGMSGDEVIGSAFGSSANALSINMDVLDRTDDTPS